MVLRNWLLLKVQFSRENNKECRQSFLKHFEVSRKVNVLFRLKHGCKADIIIENSALVFGMLLIS